MDVTKIITKYPEVFNSEDRSYTEIEAIRLISSTVSKGSDAQKVSFDIQDGYNAMCKLLKLGLRTVAIPFAEMLLQKAAWHQHFDICRDICNKLVYHYYLFKEMDIAKKYDRLYKVYSSILDVEYEAQRIYGELIYNTNVLGIEVDKESVQDSMVGLGLRLDKDSCKYSYYYYQSICILSEGEDFHAACEEAIDYFENLYFKHTAYISIFKFNLLHHYRNDEQYSIMDTLLDQYLDETVEGGLPWFRYMQTRALVYVEIGDNRAKEVVSKATSNGYFSGISLDEQMIWKKIGEGIGIVVNVNKE